MSCGDRIVDNSMNGDGSGEHFFQLLIPAGTTSLVADTCFSDFDTKLAMWDAASYCGGGEPMITNDDDDGTCASYGDTSSTHSAIAYDAPTGGSNLVYARGAYK
jgi:hypothetical protein